LKIALFGGSFDPIHAGHVLPVRKAISELALDRVYFLPTAHPPHKPGRKLAPALARFAMVELALLHEPGMYASDAELDSEPVYTVDSLTRFRRQDPAAALHLILGSDSLAALPTWRRWEEILDLAHLVVLTRPGWEGAALRAQLPAELVAAWDGGGITFVAHPPVPISATELRSALAAGAEPPAGSLHSAVLDYARKYSLYDETFPRH
jgi:nicotinate-nucleotide adenylyltransferase